LKASFKPYADAPNGKLGKRIVFMAAVKMLLSLSFAEKDFLALTHSFFPQFQSLMAIIYLFLIEFLILQLLKHYLFLELSK